MRPISSAARPTHSVPEAIPAPGGPPGRRKHDIVFRLLGEGLLEKRIPAPAIAAESAFFFKDPPGKRPRFSKIFPCGAINAACGASVTPNHLIAKGARAARPFFADFLPARETVFFNMTFFNMKFFFTSAIYALKVETGAMFSQNCSKIPKIIFR